MRRVVSFVASMIIVAGCHVATARGPTDGETAVGGIARVSIVDRHSGAEIVPHFYRGEYWVAGTPGATYSISIRNRLSERLLAVASVDGVNVVSGATAAWDQTGYVFSPNQRYEITGWTLAQVLYWLSFLHAIASSALLVSFYQLKIPLITFKREKEVARKLMFDGCWITEEEAGGEDRGVMDTLFW